jgi:hypothetical protein
MKSIAAVESATMEAAVAATSMTTAVGAHN